MRRPATSTPGADFASCARFFGKARSGFQRRVVGKRFFEQSAWLYLQSKDGTYVETIWG
jgi:hypothetical protein